MGTNPGFESLSSMFLGRVFTGGINSTSSESKIKKKDITFVNTYRAHRKNLYTRSFLTSLQASTDAETDEI